MVVGHSLLWGGGFLKPKAFKVKKFSISSICLLLVCIPDSGIGAKQHGVACGAFGEYLWSRHKCECNTNVPWNQREACWCKRSGVSVKAVVITEEVKTSISCSQQLVGRLKTAAEVVHWMRWRTAVPYMKNIRIDPSLEGCLNYFWPL